MNILFTARSESDCSHHFDAVCGNVSAYVGIAKDDSFLPKITVVCKNAAHRVWRGPGRCFDNIEAALAAYKSGEMRAILQAAFNEASGSSPAQPASQQMVPN